MKKILTIILDGFGIRDEEHGNAIKHANMKHFNRIWEEYPHALLTASEEAVGLQAGQFGNSETGHQTIGAGRLIKQNETLVNEFFKSDLENNETFNNLLESVDKDIHIMGLCSDGNVHAGVDDFLNMYDLLVKNNFKKIHFHLITDGRDTDVTSAYHYIKMISDKIKDTKVGDITSICGRYYAMDRDKNYDRVQVYYDLVVKGIGINTNKVESVINAMYDKGITDEFIRPVIINKENCIKDGDVLIWMNYRADRSKQIMYALTDVNFQEFPIVKMPNLESYSFFKIDKSIPSKTFLDDANVTNPLGLYLADLGLTQARIAETEKFPHVTYFFDGGYSGKIPKCNTFNIPSPEVATYDLQPEMSAIGVTKKCIECMVQDYDFILVNFANPDMVGHSGNFLATIDACTTVDMCLGKILEKAEENFYKVIVLADHGNADIMLNENNEMVTTHTLSKVPFIIVDKSVELVKSGDLTMVAPTILEYMDIACPDEMKDTPKLFK